jgi:hypothetical protein
MWTLRLTPFDFEIVNRPDVSMHNGLLVVYEIKNEQDVSMIVQAAIPPAIMTTQEIAEATSLDPELSELRQAIDTGKRLRPLSTSALMS